MDTKDLILTLNDVLKLLKTYCPNHEILNAIDVEKYFLNHTPRIFSSNGYARADACAVLHETRGTEWETRIANEVFKNHYVFSIPSISKCKINKYDDFVFVLCAHEHQHGKQYSLMRSGQAYFNIVPNDKRTAEYAYSYAPAEQDANHTAFIALCDKYGMSELDGLEFIGNELQTNSTLKQFLSKNSSEVDYNFVGIPNI